MPRTCVSPAMKTNSFLKVWLQQLLFVFIPLIHHRKWVIECSLAAVAANPYRIRRRIVQFFSSNNAISCNRSTFRRPDSDTWHSRHRAISHTKSFRIKNSCKERKKQHRKKMETLQNIHGWCHYRIVSNGLSSGEESEKSMCVWAVSCECAEFHWMSKWPLFRLRKTKNKLIQFVIIIIIFSKSVNHDMMRTKWRKKKLCIFSLRFIALSLVKLVFHSIEHFP